MDLQVSPPQPPRVALVHDFLVSVRGADRVFLEICDLYRDADIFLPIFDERRVGGALAGRSVRTSFLQRVRPTDRTFRALLPFYPSAIESFDLSGYDLVISSSSAWAHAVLCPEGAVHVSYCHNPFRYAWNERRRTLDAWREPITRSLMSGFFRRWRSWDWIAAQRVDRYVTNSRLTQSRIEAYFGRESTVVHPPVDTERLAPGTLKDHYLVLSALMSHKQIDVAVRAFNTLGLPLVVVGEGPDARRLRSIARPNVRFTGRVDDVEAAALLSGCQALVVTSVEEFGIAAVEAQAAGRPVIAAGAGGARETVIPGVTGRLWSGGVDELVEAVRDFDPAAVDPQACVANARRFGREEFRRRFLLEVAAALEAKAEQEPAAGDGLPSPGRISGGLARTWR